MRNKGPAGFTIAEAARLAGVSPAAPYRHFRDAEALLAEVALRGFDRFAAALTAAWNNGRPDPLRAFEAIGRAYLAFARNEPAYYAAMFEARLLFDDHPPLLAAGDRAFVVLRDAADRLAASLPRDQRPPSLMMALHVWALAHGIAALFVRGGPSRGSCRWRRRSCWRPVCWSICTAWGWRAVEQREQTRRNRRGNRSMTDASPCFECRNL